MRKGRTHVGAVGTGVKAGMGAFGKNTGIHLKAGAKSVYHANPITIVRSMSKMAIKTKKDDMNDYGRNAFSSRERKVSSAKAAILGGGSWCCSGYSKCGDSTPL